MAGWKGEDLNKPYRDNKATGLALSAYEAELFARTLQKNSPEEAQGKAANDARRLTSAFGEKS